jgi:oxygen-independent coproporphyrinogen III oxidase
VLAQPPAEWTVECNPATLSPDKARLLRQAGVNRVSLGVQSFDEAILQRLGRVHNRAEVIRSFDILRRAGFDNVNLDLMFAVPGQTLDSWRQTLREAVALGANTFPPTNLPTRKTPPSTTNSSRRTGPR